MKIPISETANCANLLANHATNTRERCCFHWSGTNAAATALGWKNKRSKENGNQSKTEYIIIVQCD